MDGLMWVQPLSQSMDDIFDIVFILSCIASWHVLELFTLLFAHSFKNKGFDFAIGD